MNWYHSSVHFGPSMLAALLIWWMARRCGQLSQPDRSGRLPLIVTGATVDNSPAKRPRAIVLITLALVFGVAIGLPVATAILAAQADGGHLHVLDHGGTR